jgi:hypothetical protein
MEQTNADCPTRVKVKAINDNEVWRILKRPSHAGFAIGSPGSPHVSTASDQIREFWVITSEAM